MSRETAVMQRKARADAWFAVYVMLGAERSLRAVYEHGHALGATIGNSTLARYSHDYDWVARAAEWDAERGAQAGRLALHDAIASDIRQAELGRTLQRLAQKGADKLLEDDALTLTGTEIARLVAEGVKTERLASGQATQIIDMMTGLWDLILGTVLSAYRGGVLVGLDLIFDEVDAPPELRERAVVAMNRYFAPRIDAMVDSSFEALQRPEDEQ